MRARTEEYIEQMGKKLEAFVMDELGKLQLDHPQPSLRVLQVAEAPLQTIASGCMQAALLDGEVRQATRSQIRGATSSTCPC